MNLHVRQTLLKLGLAEEGGQACSFSMTGCAWCSPME